MVKRYSRLSKTEEGRNVRKALVFTFLTISSLGLFLFFGLPTVAKFAAFLTDIRKSGEPVEKNDTTPPVPPHLDSLSEATNKLKTEIKGRTEPGVTVTLFLNGRQEELLANKEGEFTYTFSLSKGENSISALAKDSSGNKSQKSNVIRITFDIEPPEIEISSPENKSEYYGSKQRQVVIEGKTEEGVSVTINDRVVVVENDGSFAFTTTLSEGENQFTIKAEDKAGNTTEKSLSLNFSL